MDSNSHLKNLKKMAFPFILLMMGILNSYSQTEQFVATVNQQKIEVTELKQEMLRNRTSVMNQMMKQYHLQSFENFWDKDFNGVKPMEVLRKTSLDSLIAIKIQQQILMEKNLWPYQKHQDLINDLLTTNQKRKELKENGTILYGPVAFTEITFFDYQFSNAINAYKTKMMENSIPDSLLINQFNEMKKTSYAKSKKSFDDLKPGVQMQYIDKEYQKIIIKKTAAAVIIIDKKKLKLINI